MAPMNSPLAHLDAAVTAWSASREAIRDAAGLDPPGLGGSLEDSMEGHLAGQAHNEWEGGDDDGNDG